MRKIKDGLPYAQSRDKTKQFLLSFFSKEREREKNLRESLLLFHSEKIWNGYESSELFRINYSLIRFLMVM